MIPAVAQLGETPHGSIQPVEGPSSYQECQNGRGEGFHHVGYLVNGMDAATKRIEGFPVVQSG